MHLFQGLAIYLQYYAIHCVSQFISLFFHNFQIFCYNRYVIRIAKIKYDWLLQIHALFNIAKIYLVEIDITDLLQNKHQVLVIINIIY